MLRLILKAPHKALQTPCTEVTEFDDSLHRLASDLIFTLAKSKREGVGLAANQIGDLRRVFLIWDQESGSGPFIFVNPKIRKSRGEQTATEGCLSLEPADDCKVKRAKIVDWTAQDLDGKPIRGKFHDFDARVFQHEMDHLAGMTIKDRKAKR
jgi:peptide deformylase